MRLTLFTRPNCHLCEEAIAELHQLRRRYPHELDLVDITADPALQSTYGERVPVVHVGEREYSAPLTRAVLERALRGGQP